MSYFSLGICHGSEVDLALAQPVSPRKSGFLCGVFGLVVTHQPSFACKLVEHLTPLQTEDKAISGLDRLPTLAI